VLLTNFKIIIYNSGKTGFRVKKKTNHQNKYITTIGEQEERKKSYPKKSQKKTRRKEKTYNNKCYKRKIR